MRQIIRNFVRCFGVALPLAVGISAAAVFASDDSCCGGVGALGTAPLDCDGTNCKGQDVSNCNPTDIIRKGYCCANFDSDPTYYCATCNFRQWECPGGIYLGRGSNCTVATNPPKCTPGNKLPLILE